MNKYIIINYLPLPQRCTIIQLNGDNVTSFLFDIFLSSTIYSRISRVSVLQSKTRILKKKKKILSTSKTKS